MCELFSDKEKKLEIISSYNEYKARNLLLGNSLDCMLVDDLFYVYVNKHDHVVLFGLNKDNRDGINRYIDSLNNHLILPDLFDVVSNLSYISQSDIKKFNIVSRDSLYTLKSSDPLHFPVIEFGESVQSFYHSLFYNWDILGVSVPHLKKLKESVFSSSNLLSFDGPFVESVDDFCFRNCKSLRSVSLPNVLNLGIHAFDGCINLSEVTLGSLYHLPDNLFLGLPNLSKVNGIENCISIGQSCFHDSGIKELDLRNCSKIDSIAFSHSGIRKIMISDKLSYVGACAFLGVENSIFNRFTVEYYGNSSNPFSNMVIERGNESFIKSKLIRK